ncbi:MAG: Spy/CpxP family protein refolding chaperone [Rubrivivax sp.]|nr:Spy/CpxP family protein refolding chaperone [Rubrivivax sp.]
MDTRKHLSTRTATLRATHQPLRMLVATLGIALAATLAQTAMAQPAGGPGMGMGMGMGMMDQGGPGMGHHGRQGGKHGMGMDGRQMTRMLDMVAATPEQRAKIKAITEAARTDMSAQREAGRALHEQSRAIFTQPNIDANAAEALRQKMLAHHDQASKRMLQMKLDLAAVLTPEQRKTMADRMAQRGTMMQRHRAERATLDGKAAR